MALFESYDVSVVSDEIWPDIILNGNHCIPTQSVNEYARQNTVALNAPSKTFKLSGNMNYAYSHITENYAGISLAKPQGTYMLYFD